MPRDVGDLRRHDVVQGEADRSDGAGEAAGEARRRSRAAARAARRARRRPHDPRSRCCSLGLLLLLLPAPAHAGELIDRAVDGLSSDNVYVDPDANPALTEAQAEALRDRIVGGARRADVRGRRAGGDRATRRAAIRPRRSTRSRRRVRRDGTYVIVAGRQIRALSSVLDSGEAGELADRRDRGQGRRPQRDPARLHRPRRRGPQRRRRRRGRRDRRADPARPARRGRRCAAGRAPQAPCARRGGLRGGQAQRARRPRRARRRHPRARLRRRDAGRRPAGEGRLRPRGRALHRGRGAVGAGAPAGRPRARRRGARGGPLGDGVGAGAIRGETPPERRPPCFFDPRHGPSSRDVAWSPPYGEERDVPACEADAQRVERGEEPQPREVERHGERVPYWQAGPAYAPFAGGLFGAGAAAGPADRLAARRSHGAGRRLRRPRCGRRW